MPIEKIVVWNRTDGNLGDRLKNYTVRVLDADKQTVFQSANNPTPKQKAEFAVGAASPERVIRKAAMFALTSVRGQEADAFKAIAKFLTEPNDRPAAVQALLRIPTRDWPKEDAKAQLDVVLKFIRSLPVAERTTPVALDMMQLGEGLSRPSAARRSPCGPQGTRRDRRARDPRRHPVRPDELRQGTAHRAGGQAGRVPCSRTPTSCRTTS